MQIVRKRKQKTEDVPICEGIRLDRSFWDQKENRIHTLLLKGLLVYFMTMGSIGAYLSAVGAEYQWMKVNLILLAVSLLCALCFYRRFLENTGYILVLLFAMLYGYRRRVDINHGFYVVVNRTLECVADYFQLKAARSYDQEVANPYQAVTVSMIFIGVILCVLFNMLITRHMQYVLVFFLGTVLLLLPFYMNLQAGAGYLILLLSGFILLFILRGGKNYRVTGDDRVYLRSKRKKRVEFFSIYNIRTLRQIFALAVIATAVFVLAVYAGMPKERLLQRSRTNIWKKSTQDQFEILASSGLEGLFNQYSSTGGVNHGRLGGVSSVLLDYNTDLEVTFAPYSYERVYLKSFTGVSYLPYENRWTDRINGQRYIGGMDMEFAKLQTAYEEGEDYTAWGRMKIKDVVEGRMEVYLPYYASYVDYSRYDLNNGTAEYYPRFPENETEVWPSEEAGDGQYGSFRKLEWVECLELPQENYAVISDLCETEQINGTPQEIGEKIAAYFQENIPYTYSPGRTPREEDFVNYFLEERRKGLCTHFASAAVLMFRYRGIPARYVEGYVIDYNEVLEGILTSDPYEDYYDGYAPLGKTGVVKVDVTDADAHAWVEIFTPEKGWHPVEVTPSTSESAGGESFWGAFMRVFGSEEAERDVSGEVSRQEALADVGENLLQGAGKALIVCFLILLGAGAVMALIHYGRAAVRYQKADRSDRLILQYQRYLDRRKRKDRELASCLNYEEQIRYLERTGALQFSSDEERERILDILNRAGFSDREISQEEYEEAAGKLR